MTLAELRQDQSATVIRILETDHVGQRLLEMGLTPGATATRIGAAPLGDPLEFMVRGYRLSLRKTEAAKVEVS